MSPLDFVMQQEIDRKVQELIEQRDRARAETAAAFGTGRDLGRHEAADRAWHWFMCDERPDDPLALAMADELRRIVLGEVTL